MKPFYEHNGIQIWHGDCREIVPLISVDVVVSDPPYGSGKAYDVYKDTLVEWVAIMTWLLELPYPMVFTMSHSRLFDLPRRPQWIGCWDKVFTSGVFYIGVCPSWEPICFYNLPAGCNRGKARWDDIFRVPPYGFPFKNRDHNGHPCPKPTNLYKHLIGVVPDGVICDPMMGSGTTLRAAKDVGRQAVGIDISERYCEIAANSLAQEVFIY